MMAPCVGGGDLESVFQADNQTGFTELLGAINIRAFVSICANDCGIWQ
jgi:hypothetical protein